MTVTGGKPVKLSGSGRESFKGKILSRLAKDGVFDGHRWNNLSTCHCSIATPKKTISDARKNNDVPCPSELSDPKRQVSVSRNVVIARFSDSVKRGTSGNFRFQWSHFLGRADAHRGARSMYLASRSAECCSDIVERQSRL